MLERRDRIYGVGGEVVVVVHDEAGRVRGGVLRGLDVPFRVVIDLEREAYRAWGLPRASFAATYLSRYAFRDYAERLRGRGRGMLPGRDPRQLGGDFVVDGSGRVTYSYPQANIADRPPVAVLVRELRAAAGPSAAGPSDPGPSAAGPSDAGRSDAGPKND
jgi:hypothetical protein